MGNSGNRAALMIVGVISFVSASLSFTMIGYSQVETSFEVASLKLADSQPHAPFRPGSASPGRIRFHKHLKGILMYAYNLMDYQISGPSWLESTQYDIDAKVPRGATREQIQLMVQHLLSERLMLVAHLSKKEMPVYFLEVGKTGVKMHLSNSPPATATPPVQAPPAAQGRGREPIRAADLPMTNGTRITTRNQHSTLEARKESMQKFAVALSRHLDRPVIDKTGLGGEYDFDLEFAAVGMLDELNPPDSTPSILPANGESLFTALQRQLGLKLETRKGPIDVLVVDHVERLPRGN